MNNFRIILFLSLLTACDDPKSGASRSNPKNIEEGSQALTAVEVEEIFTSDINAYTQMCRDFIQANVDVFKAECPVMFPSYVKECELSAATHQVRQIQAWQARLLQKDSDLRLCYMESIGVSIGDLICSLQLQYKIGSDLDGICNKKVYL